MSARQLRDAVLERYLADALPAAERERVEQVLATSPADTQRLEQLRADSAAFLTQHPPGRFAAQVSAKRKSRTWWGLWLIPALATAASLALYAGGTLESPWTAKGGVALAVHVRKGDGSVKHSPGEPLAPGATLRFEVTAPKPGYVAVLSRDAAGKVTVYHPYGGAQAAPYDPKRRVLESTVELDNQPGREHLYALYSAEPFPLDWAVSALNSGEPIKREGVEQADVVIDVR